MPPIAPPRGTKDLLPAEATAWEWLHRVHREVAESFGYRLIDTPIFEATELFSRGVGSGTDIVDKEMYSFADKGGRSMTLRPEGTAGVLRAVLGAHLEQEQRPVRVHYAGPMFRYDKPQAGRYRQFFQVGAECIGDRSPHLDAEIIEMAWRFYERLGITGLSLQVNSLGDGDDRARYREALVAYYTPLRDQLCADCRHRLEVNPLRLLDCKRDQAHVDAAPRIGEVLSAESRDFFAAVLADLDAAGIPHHENPRLVRGLDYYAHTAFEFWHTSLHGAQNALGGGGRYDGLAQVLGFPATPGVGYALGVERILMIAGELGVDPQAEAAAQVWVCSTGESTAEALRIVRQLRTAKIRTVADVESRKLDKKLRDAGRQGARFAVLTGLDEGLVLRDLDARSQEIVDDVAALPERIRRVLTTGDEP